MKQAGLPQALSMKINSYAEDRGAVKVQCLLSDQEFSGMLTGDADNGAVRTDLVSRDVYGPVAHCTYSLSGEGISGTLHSLQQGGMVCLLAAERGEFFRRVLRIARMLHPRVIMPFSESSEIRHILTQFEMRTGVPLLHKRSVKRTIFGAMPKTSVEWDRNAENRKYQGVDDVFKTARANDLLIDSLRVFAGSGDNLDIAVSRGGAATVHAGDFGSIYDHILVPIMSGAAKRKKRFSHRSRSECSDKKPRPLLVKYDKDVFADEDNRDRFCSLIDSYTHCNYSIVHAGNPHIYISVVDRIDNSSLALRSIGDDSLAIIPQIRTSEASLMRVTAFLSSAFWEGDISEYEP